jgi:catechol 2,3-dioxygenase-like lactoylglutathione lyase family enzyme
MVTTADLDLGPIDQVAYVVHHMDEALPRYTALFGPFEVADSPLRGCTYRGRTVDCTLRLAVNRSSPVEVELIAVLAGEAPHREFLEAHGEGLHHVRFRVDDLDRRLEGLSARGIEVIFYKRFAPHLAFAYAVVPAAPGGHWIELLEMDLS